MSQISKSDLILKLSALLRETAKPLRDLQKNADFNEKMILSESVDKLSEAQDLFNSIREYYDTVLDTSENLSKEIMQYKQWTGELANYESFRLISGTTVIISKDLNISPYAKEWFCKHCFDNKKKSQLQPTQEFTKKLFCPECNTIFTQVDSDWSSTVKARAEQSGKPLPKNSFSD
jgi:hypothetical protein